MELDNNAKTLPRDLNRALPLLSKEHGVSPPTIYRILRAHRIDMKNDYDNKYFSDAWYFPTWRVSHHRDAMIYQGREGFSESGGREL